MVNYILMRIGDGKHFISSSKEFTWGINSKVACSKWFISNAKEGDILAFVKGGGKGPIIAVATFIETKKRIIGPLISITKTNEELGWTESEIKSFAERLQKQLTLREVNAQQQKEKSISDKSFDAMLKGLDLNSSGTTRQGKADRDRDQQDTTTRQSAPPSRYKQLVEGYQRSVSGAKDGKPK